MRHSDGGLQPASNHATSSSRDCNGVISIWSRAISNSNQKGASIEGARVTGWSANPSGARTNWCAARSSRRRGFVGVDDGRQLHLAARAAEAIEQTAELDGIRIG